MDPVSAVPVAGSAGIPAAPRTPASSLPSAGQSQTAAPLAWTPWWRCATSRTVLPACLFATISKRRLHAQLYDQANYQTLFFDALDLGSWTGPGPGQN